jgi:hypothetical protein
MKKGNDYMDNEFNEAQEHVENTIQEVLTKTIKENNVKLTLLQVADEIEQDENYHGNHWMSENTKGCAMSRIILAQEGVTWSPYMLKSFYFALPGFNDNKEQSAGYAPQAMEFITGISADNFWEGKFQQWSCTASKEDTAKILRLIANEQYDFNKSIKINLEANP